MAFNFGEFYNNVFLNRIVGGAVIFFIGLILGKVFGKLTSRILHEIDFNRITSKLIRLNSEKLLSKLVSNIVYLFTIILVLNKLEITGFIWRGFLLFLIVVIISNLLLHIKDLLPNLYGWIKIKNKIKQDDIIKTELIEGKVNKIRLLTTMVTTNKGDTLFIPNFSLLSNIGIKK